MSHPLAFETYISCLSQTRVKVNVKKFSYYDCISGLTIKYLPSNGFIFLKLIFNNKLRLNHFPIQWNGGKSNKRENIGSAYRPTSWLSIFLKIIEKIYLRRLVRILEQKLIILDHQLDFRNKHVGVLLDVEKISNKIKAIF